MKLGNMIRVFALVEFGKIRIIVYFYILFGERL